MGKLVVREHGHFILWDPEKDKPVLEQTTVQCCHCGGHYALKPGSKRVRGYCYRCAGPVCGPQCAGSCIPVEQLLENYERGNPLDFRPVTAPVSDSPEVPQVAPADPSVFGG